MQMFGYWEENSKGKGPEAAACFTSEKQQESSGAGAEGVRETVKDNEMGEAGRGQSVWDFVEYNKGLGFYFKCKGRSQWQIMCKAEHGPLFHSSYWVQRD